MTGYILTDDNHGTGLTFKFRDGTETREQRLRRLEQTGRIKAGCPGCRAFYDAPDPVMAFAPAHTASPRCASGQRPHCTCDTCF